MGVWSIRRYAGTLPEARGIAAVEGKTFGECPYTAEELRPRLAAPGQCVWLAEVEGQVIGFAAGFRTSGLRGACLEADILAVDPAWQRQGIATALLTALRGDASGSAASRGIVNLHNPASEKAFARAGYLPSTTTYDLLLYRIRGWVPRPLPPWGGAVRPLQSLEDAAQLRNLAPESLPGSDRILSAAQERGTTLLVAVASGVVVGGVEMLEAHTLLYSGLWLESVHASPAQPRALAALIAATVEAAKERDLDEVGCLAPQDRWPLRAALLAEGFAPRDAYRTWAAPPVARGGAEA